LTFFKIYYIDVSPKALSPKAASMVVLILAALWLLLVRPRTKSNTFVIAATGWGGQKQMLLLVAPSQLQEKNSLNNFAPF
jgi:hypothetical protein